MARFDRFSRLILLFGSTLWVSCGGGGALTPAPTPSGAASRFPGSTLTPLPPSRWGGPGADLLVSEGSARVSFNCASAQIDQQLYLDPTGTFTASGLLTVAPGTIGAFNAAPSPAPNGFGGVILPAPIATPSAAPSGNTQVPARFRGGVSGELMSLTVNFVYQLVPMTQTFNLQLNRAGQLAGCAGGVTPPVLGAP